MEKEELILRNKFLDLARNAYFKNIVTHSTFLNLYEQTIFEMIQNELPNVKSIMFGGYSEAERKVVCFYCDEKPEFDMLEYIKVAPANKKFADELTHRDFLGALCIFLCSSILSYTALPAVFTPDCTGRSTMPTACLKGEIIESLNEVIPIRIMLIILKTISTNLFLDSIK